MKCMYQSNLAKGEIVPSFYSPGGISNLKLHVLPRGATPKSSFPWGQGPHLTRCVIGPHNAKWHLGLNSRRTV